MQPIPDPLLDAALGLPVEQRAKLVRALLASMDGEPVEWATVRDEALSRLRTRE